MWPADEFPTDALLQYGEIPQESESEDEAELALQAYGPQQLAPRSLQESVDALAMARVLQFLREPPGFRFFVLAVGCELEIDETIERPRGNVIVGTHTQSRIPMFLVQMPPIEGVVTDEVIRTQLRPLCTSFLRFLWRFCELLAGRAGEVPNTYQLTRIELRGGTLGGYCRLRVQYLRTQQRWTVERAVRSGILFETQDWGPVAESGTTRVDFLDSPAIELVETMARLQDLHRFNLSFTLNAIDRSRIIVLENFAIACRMLPARIQQKLRLLRLE